MSETGDGFLIPEELQWREQVRQRIAEQQVRLQQLREEGRLSAESFDHSEVWAINATGYPLMRQHLRDRPLIMTRGQLREFGSIEVLWCGGVSDFLEPESMLGYNDDDPFVIFPDDLDDL